MNKLIAIIDSGSSISKWIICGEDYKEVDSFNLPGINPTSNPTSVQYIEEIPDPFKQGIKEAYFYGSGVSTPESIKTMETTLHKHLPKLDTLEIENDLLAACRAISDRQESYVVILGTGTNSCYFDGIKIGKKIPSLGYLFDDYGSGYHIGREIIKSYFYGKMDPNDIKLFEETFGSKRDHIINPLYETSNPNSKIASYTKMLSQSSQKLRTEICTHTFDRFFRNKIDPIASDKSIAINFIGSIAFHFKSELDKSCKRNGYKLGKVLKTPLEDLLKYHQNR